ATADDTVSRSMPPFAARRTASRVVASPTMLATTPASGRAEARIGALREALPGAGDGRARAVLRVELADLMRVRGDDAGARLELLKAAAEAPEAAAVQLAVRSAAAALAPAERVTFLAASCAAAEEAPEAAAPMLWLEAC